MKILAYSIGMVLAGLTTCALANESSAVSPTVISLPTGPGTIQGLGEGFNTQLNTGTSQDKLNFSLPTGRNQMTPELSITYDSGYGNGLVGIGRRLSMPYIQRQTVDGLPSYDASNPDVFVNHEGQELVHIGNNEYRAKIEGQFVKYQKLPDGWRMTLANGSVWLLGQNSNAQHHDKSGNKVFQWFIESMTDTHGNRINYHYDSLDSSQAVYLTQIDYNDGASVVELSYEPRPDPIVSYLPTYELTKALRLKKIATFNKQNPVMSYQFDYEAASDWQTLSRLSQVSKVAANGQDSAPPTRFQYTNFDPTLAASHYVPSAKLFPLKSPDVDFIDINADGLPDVINTGFSPHRYALNQGKNPQGEVQFSKMVKMSSHSRNKLSSQYVKWGDLNGDGKINMLNAIRRNSYVYGLDENYNWQQQGNLGNQTLSINSPNARLIDINHDRLADVFVTNSNSRNGVFEHTVAINNGNGWDTPISMPMPELSVGVPLAKSTSHMADMNGDGLNDLVHMDQKSMYFFAGKGTGGYSEAIQVDNIREIAKSIHNTDKVQFADLNHDGLADLVYFNGFKVTIWPSKGLSGPQGTLAFGRPIEFTHPDKIAPSKTKLADIDGNGVVDIVWFRPGKYEKSFTYLSVIPGNLPNQLLSVDNGIGQTSSIQYATVASEMLRDEEQNTPWQHTLPMAMQVVKSVTTKDASRPGQASIKSYQYRDGFYFAKERKFVGFSEATQRDFASKSAPESQTQYSFLLGLKDEALRGKISKIEKKDAEGRLFWRETYQWSSKRLFDSFDDDKFVSFASKTRQEKTLIEQGRGNPITLAWDYAYDDFGNLILKREHGRLDGRFQDQRETHWRYSAENATSLANWQLHLPIEKTITNAQGKLVAKTQWFYDDESFSGGNLGAVSTGNLTATKKWISPSKNNQTIFSQRSHYDSYGNATEFFGPLYGEQPGHKVSVTYQEGIYPIKERLHLGGQSLVASASYDSSLGVMTQFEDFNQQQTHIQYDGLGRVTDIIAPGDSTSAPTQSFEYHYQQNFDGVMVNWIRSLQRLEKDGRHIERRQYYDGGGRNLMNVSQTEQGPRVSLKNNFDSRGLLASESMPYFSASMAFHSGTGTQVIRSKYDATNRTISKYLPATDSQGETFTYNEYLPLKSWVQDTAQTVIGGQHSGAGKWLIFDGLGQLREVKEYVGVDVNGEQSTLQDWTTQYEYDALDNFTRLTDAFGNTRTMLYDGLSRQTYRDDPNRGQAWFNYDAASNLIGTIDSRGMAHTYLYDGLSRQLEERFYQDQTAIPATGFHSLILNPTKGRISKQYQYDNNQDKQLHHLKGRLAQVIDEAGSSWFGYDQNGRRTVEKRQIKALGQQSDIYTTKRAFNSAGKLTQLTYPDSTHLDYQYGQGGELLAMGNIVNNISYSASAQLSHVQYGNGMQSDYEYDALNRLKSRETTRHSDRTRLQSLNYQYDEVSNLLGITDQRTEQDKKTIAKELGIENQYSELDQTRFYDYDDWYRIALEQNKLKLTQYRFDPIGNLISKNTNDPILGDNNLTLRYGGNTGTGEDKRYNRQGLRTTDTAGPQALTHADVGISYDAVGNQLRSGDQQFQWDHANRLKQVENPKNQAKYAYDHNNKRRLKVVKDSKGKLTTTWYISDDAEIREGKLIKFARLGSHRVAKTSKSDDTFTPEVYYIKQHLGSTELTVDNSAQVINAFNYEPFGDVEAQFGQSDKTVYRFTDKEQDKESGLGYFSQRYMNHSYGQFITPDPVFAREARFTDPQRWSPYAYGRGNPLRYSDPTGEFIGDAMSSNSNVGYHEAVSNRQDINARARSDALSAVRNACDVIGSVAGDIAFTAGGVSLASSATGAGLPAGAAAGAVALGSGSIALAAGICEIGIDAIDGGAFDNVDASWTGVGALSEALSHSSNKVMKVAGEALGALGWLGSKVTEMLSDSKEEKDTLKTAKKATSERTDQKGETSNGPSDSSKDGHSRSNGSNGSSNSHSTTNGSNGGNDETASDESV
ncbi:toxin TcdB middle/N-terminal domain-containing protein [Vibrio cyclitrophicus]|uniref:toxin TcdB middle/N-terminal domain-containing protein n=2 Tax=Vibrio cyclitrophicus TaxID=47951 RepID=UPI001F534E22|nr:toxin TcdB middle/N-terminal domain-containing protein [Vibrio cyclitrophicus]